MESTNADHSENENHTLSTNSAVPAWTYLTVPVLRVLTDSAVWRRRDVLNAARDISGVSESGMSEKLNSGALRIDDRISWAIQHLSKAHLIETVSRGQYQITNEGRTWLQKYPNGMTYKEAHLFFAPFWQKDAVSTTSKPTIATETPSLEDSGEMMDNAEKANRQQVGSELLEALREAPPEFFEQVVVDVLLKMGYGGSHGKGAAIGRSHDGGIDGIIDEDALGLDKIYIQAKRYAAGNNVGQPEIQAFVGAMHGQAAQKGVFFTTSSFTSSARNYTSMIPTHLVLIDGARLVNLMMDFKVGVQIKTTYETLKIDQDYFV